MINKHEIEDFLHSDEAFELFWKDRLVRTDKNIQALAKAFLIDIERLAGEQVGPPFICESGPALLQLYGDDPNLEPVLMEPVLHSDLNALMTRVPCSKKNAMKITTAKKNAAKKNAAKKNTRLDHDLLVMIQHYGEAVQGGHVGDEKVLLAEISEAITQLISCTIQQEPV